MCSSDLFKSAARAGADLDKIKGGAKAKKKDADKKDGEKDSAAAIEPLLAQFKVVLGKAVKDVRPSERLTESAVCLVTGEGDMDARLEKILKQNRQAGAADTTPQVLAVNPHPPPPHRPPAPAQHRHRPAPSFPAPA